MKYNFPKNQDGKPYNYDYSKIRYCIICGKKLHHCSKTGYCSEHYRTDRYRRNMSKSIKRCYKNGTKVAINPKTKNSIYKKGWYNGYWCDSSWELIFVIYNLEHNIKFERNQLGFEYLYKNEKHKWFPDFILENKLYIEIKNYDTNITKAKFKYFKLPLKVLYKDDIKYMFDYVIKKYGKDFIKLYAS